MNIKKLCGGLVFKSARQTAAVKTKLKKSDLGVLKVALMVAAVDGRVLPEEYAAFKLLAMKGFGYSDSAAAQALKESMRSAGYIMMEAERSTNKELVEMFLAEAMAALPSGFDELSVKNVRQALVTWIAMAISDGVYSSRERLCIEALRLHFAEQRATQIEKENEYWRSIPANVRCVVEDYPGARLKLATKDFAAKVAEIVDQFGDSADAKLRLESLVAKGE